MVDLRRITQHRITFAALATVGSVLFSSCTERRELPTSAVEERQAALTASGNQIIGFENPTANWTIAQGSIPALQSSTTHTQGTVSLTVKARGYVVVKSAAFPVSNAVTGPILYDVFLPTQQPNPSFFGASQLYVTCPSHSVFNAFLGQDDLTGLPTGQFTTLSFNMPTSPGAQLANGCSDLSFSIALNVPTNATGTYLLDNLHFRGSEGNVQATVSCVAKRTPTIYTAFFGYINHENFVVTIPIGADNSVSPAAPPFQPTTFAVGTQTAALSVDFQLGQTANWHLPNGSATASSSTPLCPGSTPAHVSCAGVPHTTDAGCAIVVRLPNTTGPTTDPTTLGTIDPKDLPPASTGQESLTEAAIVATQFSTTSILLTPGSTNTISLNLTQSSGVSAKAIWTTSGTVSLTLQQGTRTVTGNLVNLGSLGGANEGTGAFSTGAVQVQVRNTGQTGVTVGVTSGICPLSEFH
jgi:hypothetical protein